MKPIVVVAVILLSLPPSLNAQDLLEIQLGFDTLPTEQGWTFSGIDAPLTLEDVFRVDGTTLYQDTMGATSAAYFRYDLTAYLDTSHWSVEVRARCLEQELGWFGFSFGLGLNGSLGAFAIQPTEIQFPGQVSVPFDGRNWHEYQMIGDMQAQSFSLYIDDQLFATRPMRPDYPEDHFWVGDATGAGNAIGEIDYLRFRLGNEQPVDSRTSTWGGVKALYR